MLLGFSVSVSRGTKYTGLLKVVSREILDGSPSDCLPSSSTLTLDSSVGRKLGLLSKDEYKS